MSTTPEDSPPPSAKDGSVTGEVRTTYENHKRQAFDGMRAYHESEIAHKEQTVSIITRLLAATGAIYAAIIAAKVALRGPFPGELYIPWIVFIFFVLGIFLVILAANSKVRGDHESYKKWTRNHNHACKKLQPDDIELQWPVGGPGYKLTQNLLAAYGIAAGLLVLAITLCVSIWSVRIDISPTTNAKLPVQSMNIRGTNMSCDSLGLKLEWDSKSP